jgi:hypothetical protein
VTLLKGIVAHSCTSAVLVAFSDFRKSRPFPLSKPSFLTPISKNIAYFNNKDDSIHPAPYIIVICSVSGSVETPSIVGQYTIIDKCTNFLYD